MAEREAVIELAALAIREGAKLDPLISTWTIAEIALAAFEQAGYAIHDDRAGAEDKPGIPCPICEGKEWLCDTCGAPMEGSCPTEGCAGDLASAHGCECRGTLADDVERAIATIENDEGPSRSKYARAGEHTDRLAIVILARLVRDEHPAGLSLVEIVETWGNATPLEVAAVGSLEAALTALEPPPSSAS